MIAVSSMGKIVSMSPRNRVLPFAMIISVIYRIAVQLWLKGHPDGVEPSLYTPN